MGKSAGVPLNRAGNSPGITVKMLIRSAPDEVLLAFLPDPLRRLLETLQPELLEGDRLRDLVAGLWTPGEMIEDGTSRRFIAELLPSGKASELAELLKIPSADDLARYVATDRLPRKSRRTIEDYFRVGKDKADPDDVPMPLTRAKPGYSLYEYQRTAVRDVLDALRTPPRRAVLHLPTGAGKTRVAMHVICEHLRHHEPTVVLWLAYNGELLEQAADAFETAWTYIGNRELSIVRFWGESEHDVSSMRDGIIVAGLGKMNALSGRDFQSVLRLADRTTLTVMDEAHQSVAATYQELLSLFATKRMDAALLGLTATPGRTWTDIDADAELADFFDRRKVTLQVPGFSNPVDFLIKEGYLAHPKFIPLNITASLHLSREDLQLLATSLEVPAGVLRQLAEDEQRNLRIINELENLLTRHRRVIFFATTVTHARLMALVLRARGHSAEAITGVTPKPERQSVIQRYRANTSKSMVICNYGVLTTGFDAPATSATLIARPTRSLVLYSQMVGRAIRGPRSGGNARAEIVTVIDPQMPGFGEVAEAFTNWEDVWNQ